MEGEGLDAPASNENKRAIYSPSNDIKRFKNQDEDIEPEKYESAQFFPLQDLPDDILAFIFKTYFDFEERQVLRCVGPWFYEKLTSVDPSFKTWNINLTKDIWDFEEVQTNFKEALEVRDQSHITIKVDCDSWKSNEKVSFLTLCEKQIKSLSIVMKRDDISVFDSKFAFENLEKLKLTTFEYHAKKLKEGDISPSFEGFEDESIIELHDECVQVQNNCFKAAKHILTSHYGNLRYLTLNYVYKIDLSGIEFPHIETLQLEHCGEIVMQQIIEGCHRSLKDLLISKSFYPNPEMKEEAKPCDVPNLKLDTLTIYAPFNEFISSIVKVPCDDLKSLNISCKEGYEFGGSKLSLSKLEEVSINHGLHLYFNPILEQCAKTLKRLQVYLIGQKGKKEVQLSVARLPFVESLGIHCACGYRTPLYGDIWEAPPYKYIVSLCQPTLIHLGLGEFHYDEISGMQFPRLKHFSGYFDRHIEQTWKFLDHHAGQLKSLEILLSEDNLGDARWINLPELEVLLVRSLRLYVESSISVYLPKLKDVYVNVKLSLANGPLTNKNEDASCIKKEWETV